jgi:hypothetical protein
MVCGFPQFTWAHLASISQKVGVLPLGSHDGETGWTSAAERKPTVPCRGHTKVAGQVPLGRYCRPPYFLQGFEKGERFGSLGRIHIQPNTQSDAPHLTSGIAQMIPLRTSQSTTENLLISCSDRERDGANSVLPRDSISPALPVTSAILLETVRSIHQKAGVPFPLWPQSRLTPDRSCATGALQPDLRVKVIVGIHHGGELDSPQ